jgi:hypothetical protein
MVRMIWYERRRGTNICGTIRSGVAGVGSATCGTVRSGTSMKAEI